MSVERLGYDIESPESGEGRLRFIEVKGRIQGTNTVSVTPDEMLTELNAPDAFILAIADVSNGLAREPRHVRRPFSREPDFGATVVTYKLAELRGRAEAPS